MKFVGKFFLTLLLLILLLLTATYILLQTQWGAGWLGRTLSSDNGWQISLRSVEYRFSAPTHLIFSDVRLGYAGQPPVLEAKKVDLGLHLMQFSQPLNFASILLEQGRLNLTTPVSSSPVSAERLQLHKMNINGIVWSLPVTAQRVDGGIIPWKPQRNNLIGNQGDFQLSSEALTLMNLSGKNVLIQGNFDRHTLVLSNVGADIAGGALTGNGARDAAGNWHIANLRLNNLRLQTTLSLKALLRPVLTALPAIRLDRLDMTDARLQGPDWAVTDLDLSLQKFMLKNGDWQSDNGSLSMNANSMISDGLIFNDPIVNLLFTPQGIKLTQFSSRFANGLIRTQGQWVRADKHLTLNQLAIAGLEYTLPDNWRQQWMQSLPSWLGEVTVTQLTANRNLLIDINPAWPFQITALDGRGDNLLLVRQHQWGLWQGNMTLNAAEATFNRVDVRHPSVALDASDRQISINELSAFTGEGLLEASGSISQQPQRSITINFTGKAVPVNILHDWGWPELPLEGPATLTLQASGSLAAGLPFAPSVNGVLSATTDGNNLQQRMINGKVQ
ncbi:AsmA family protein [Enterobacteriaceae bacterium LUAb1]